METNAFVESLLLDPSMLQEMPGPLPDPMADVVVARLRAEAERHWWINARRALELADMIIHIGRVRNDLGQTALGLMTRGDALKFLGQLEEAWDTLGEAGRLYQAARDDVGWARTRIGRLLICVDLKHVEEALADAEQARAVFLKHGIHEKQLVLDLNTAIVCNLLGDQRQALALYRSALATAEELGEIGQQHLAPLHINIGNVLHLLGDFRQALVYEEQARTLFLARNETRGAALAEFNSAHIEMDQGHYRRALQLLHHAHDLYIAADLTFDALNVRRHLLECYLLLNRYAEARDLAQEVSTAYHAAHSSYREALTLLQLATAEAELGNITAAQAALQKAEPIFVSVGAVSCAAITRLRRAKIALRQGDPATARSEAAAAAVIFEAIGQQADYALAVLLEAQAFFVSGDLSIALQHARQALNIARHCNVPPVRYAAQLLLGQIAEVEGNTKRAVRCYQAAAATVERVQQGLTITLRPAFLEDKGEALRSLLALHLRSGDTRQALEVLERAKSQVLLSYLSNREQFLWADKDEHSRHLIAELNQLREEHHWFYRLAHQQLAREDQQQRPVSTQEALSEVALRERRMRTITEQLYLYSGEENTIRQTTPSLSDVQAWLDDDTLLVEFYNDGMNLWVFTLERQSLQVNCLHTTVQVLDRLLTQLQVNISAALALGLFSTSISVITDVAQRILQQLYTLLLKPIEVRTRNRSRLVIVPYGSLHYVPFHLLRHDAAYLIEQHEVVILPSAGLAMRPRVARQPSAIIFAHSWNDRLPNTTTEAQLVQQLLGGQVFYEQAARREALWVQPSQVLHIAAHGEHRIDNPDLSYIELDDGQLYTDDLLQHDLSYELVTLSACETGRANVAAGDELIGLGRGFLYAGAGALVTSLWRVADDWTLRLMHHMYAVLHSGASKAAALRDAQRALLLEHPRLHPAFWGAFQLVGDASPLSSGSPIVRKEHEDV